MTNPSPTLNVTARMIAADEEYDGAPRIGYDFDLDEGHGPVHRATLTITSMGVFEACLNGTPVSDEVLTPGWTSFEWRHRYASYDVTAQLEGRNSFVATVGNGWYRGRLTWNGDSAFYGNELALLAQLDIEFEDGHRQQVASDDTWRSGPSAITANDLYDGESIDARRRAETALPGGTHVVTFDADKLTPYVGPAMRRQEEIAATQLITTPSGARVLDFGQNLVGWIKFTATGPVGQVITVRYAEVLENDELGVRPLRTAEATDRFVLSGGVDEFEPTFTLHGFRYVEIDGWPGELTTSSVQAVVVSSDLERIGYFETSNPLVNQLHKNVVWGMRGNFVDVPTDCPQRDERLGWTGDIAVFAPTAAFLFDAQPFLRNWLVDVWLEQEHGDGIIPFVVPDVLKMIPPIPEFPDPDATAIWSDAGVWVPWALWQAYGDLDVLRDQWPSMVSHLHRVESLLSPEGLWDTTFQFGDWLDPDAPPSDPAAAKADKGVVATASIYRSAKIVADAAALLGKDTEEAEFAALAKRLYDAFQRAYVQPNGRILSDSTTVYSLAITFGLLSTEQTRLAGDRLAELVTESGYRISTGFAGTPYITDALTLTGHLDDAYALLLQKDCPSWLYPVTMGATTIWERWDSMLPDGSINPGEMTSFNHYALGAVADWLHRVVGGLAPLEPGYASVLVAPQPGGGITSATTKLATKEGNVRVAWKVIDDQLTVDVDVPDGVSGIIRLPGASDKALPAGSSSTTVPWAAR